MKVSVVSHKPLLVANVLWLHEKQISVAASGIHDDAMQSGCQLKQSSLSRSAVMSTSNSLTS